MDSIVEDSSDKTPHERGSFSWSCSCVTSSSVQPSNWNSQFVFIVRSLLPPPPPPPLTRLLAHCGLKDNQQSMFLARSTSTNTVYYSFFKLTANREWVQGRETQQSSSCGAAHSPFHWKLGHPCTELGSSINKEAFSGSASQCEPVLTCPCLHVNWKFQFDLRALTLHIFHYSFFFFT